MIHVVSTGFHAPKRGRCESSVRLQLAPHVHTYVEAGEQYPPKTKLENIYHVVSQLKPSDVVALVDGDDWLACVDALDVVQAAHDGGAWVTWGSFEYADGRPGFMGDLDWSVSVRAQPWVTTHLKTFRAGLMQRIRLDDLQYASGRWIDRADDPAFFWPMIEMAGRERCRFIRDILYIYNEADAWHRSAPGQDLRHQANMHNLSRSRPPYGRVEEL